MSKYFNINVEISKVKDNEYNNDELNNLLSKIIYKINNYTFNLDSYLYLINLIKINENFIPISEKFNWDILKYFIEYNDINNFKYFYEIIKNKDINFLNKDTSYSIMKDICWYDKKDFFEIIQNNTKIDFTINRNRIPEHTLEIKNFEMLSLLLQHRPEIKKHDDFYKKCFKILRNNKIRNLTKTIYNNK